MGLKLYMPTDIVPDAQRLYQGIGRVVVEFQFMEHVVAEVLASLLQMRRPSDTHRITAAMSYGQKVDLMCDLYLDRKKEGWPSVDLRLTRDALKASEAFRNAVVHSFWYVDGIEPQWMRTKASLRSKGQLSVSTGTVNLEAFEEGAKCLTVVRDWYLGLSEEVRVAMERLKIVTVELSTTKEEPDKA